MKKLQKVAYVTAGLLMGLSVAFTSNAFASTGVKTLQATYRDIKLVVDGKTVTPKDGNGNVVEPFVVDGTTYLPVRAIAEALGKDAIWDGNANTVYITDRSSQNSTGGASVGTSVDLSEMIEYGARGGNLEIGKMRDTNDSWHEHVVYREPRYCPDTFKDYLLNGNYSKIEGSVLALYGSSSAIVGSNIKIWGDGKLLYDAGGLKDNLSPIQFSVDLSNVKILTLSWESPAKGDVSSEERFGVTATLYKSK